jgi:deoxyribodipyrimidine photo-lyase
MRWVPDADGSLLQAWKDGKTGVPIVDAGMRELKSVGWMHNRLRQITASYLTFDLLIDWRKGEDHFWQYLVDADLASNSFGWQAVAGTVSDATEPRIFNPFLQSEKFDKDGDYIKKWCPELAGLTGKNLGNPSEVDPKILKNAGITLGEEYPRIRIDHYKAKDRVNLEWRRINPQREENSSNMNNFYPQSRSRR